MNIRGMTPPDFVHALCLVSEFTDESLHEYGTHLDLDHLRGMFEETRETSFVAVEDDKVVGVLAGRIIHDMCSALPIYEEVIWFMNKDYRVHGMKLFDHMVNWCKEHDISRITICCMHNSRTEALTKIYKRMGFKPVETRFIKQLD